MHIKNIIFDNGGVLSESRSGHWFITPNFWKILNIDEKTSIDAMKCSLKKYQDMLTQEPKTELEEYNLFSNYYYQVLKDFNYNNLSHEIAGKLSKDCVYNDYKYIFYDDIDVGLERLSKNYNLYIISDAWPSSYRALNNRGISKFFKSIIISSMESKTKLEGLFEVFLEKNKNVIPEESIFIDDRSDILDEATKCGFNVALMDRKHECTDNKYKVIHEIREVEMNNYLIIHGSFGSKDGNWFPWLKNELEKDNKNVVVPQMPVGVGNQNFESWSKVLDELKIDENTIIIAHSIAPIFVCKYLITNKIKVKKLIFVSGFNNYLGIDPDYDAVNEPMFIDNFEDIKKYCNDIICYYSDNDPYVKYEEEKSFANVISNEQYVIKNGGHINAESGYTKFEEILKVL